MFSLWSSSYDLRGNYILSLSKPKTTTYGLNSFSYFSAKQWNALLDFFRTSFLQTLRPKYRMLPSCKLFLLVLLKLKIVNNIFFSFMCLLLLTLFYYYYLQCISCIYIYIYISILFSCSVSLKILACYYSYSKIRV